MGVPARNMGRSRAEIMAPPEYCCYNLETALGHGLATDGAAEQTANPVPRFSLLQIKQLWLWASSRASSMRDAPPAPVSPASYGLLVSCPPFQRCQYIRISLIASPSVSQKMAPRASTQSPEWRRRKTHLNSVENQGPAA